MAVTSADVLRIAPELAKLSLTDADWASFIADAQLQMNASAWGTRADLGLKYMTAHLVAVANPSAGGRVVQSQSVGQVSQTFAVGAAASLGPLGMTRFGIEFARLQRLLPNRFLVP